MTDIDRYLTDEAVEQAAKALYEDGWEGAGRDARQYHREAAERALSAVLPGIIRQAKAEAWREGHEAAALRVPEGVWCDVAAPHPGNPYATAKPAA